MNERESGVGVGHPDLSGLVLGELANDRVFEAADHLEHCAQCTGELRELAVGHALLAGARRVLSNQEPLVELAELPPLELTKLEAETKRPSGRWLRPLGLMAAAVALVVGSAVVTAQLVDQSSQNPSAPLADGSSEDPEPSVPDGPQVELEPIDATSNTGSGQVAMASAGQDDGSTVTMKITTDQLPKLKKGQFYYAWLLKPETNKMLPLGQLDVDGTATFRLPLRLVKKYSAIDISLEKDNGDPQHSPISVLRAVNVET
jgi:hypothetical protein